MNDLNVKIFEMPINAPKDLIDNITSRGDGFCMSGFQKFIISLFQHKEELTVNDIVIAYFNIYNEVKKRACTQHALRGLINRKIVISHTKGIYLKCIKPIETAATVNEDKVSELQKQIKVPRQYWAKSKERVGLTLKTQ